jgi:L-threonylcarbamoyladenylate synthase
MRIIAYQEILSKENLTLITSVIKSDGVIIYPTDTLYGLGGNFFSSAVINSIDIIKGRQNSPYSIAVDGLEMLEKLVEVVPDLFYSLYERFLPGRLTFLFKASKSIKKKYLKGSDKIGIRIPGLPGLLKLIGHLETPLITTSVNKKGQKPMNSREEIINTFSNPQAHDRVSLFIDFGNLPSSKGSTIIDLTTSPTTFIRKGDDYKKLNDYLKL